MIHARLKSSKTLSDVLNAVDSILNESTIYYGHGTDNSWDESVQLVCFCLSIPLDSDDSILSKTVTDTELKTISRFVDERITKCIPLPYLTQVSWFMGLPFYVDERVLIPRSPFAELIRNEFSPWTNSNSIKSILEIGTGSGCMSIAAAKIFPDVTITATDISSDALCVATKNVKQYNLQKQIMLLQSDVFSKIEGLFDVIMSNPPYVPDEEMATLPQEYAAEPDLALRAADHGLAVVNRILRSAHEYLTETGVLIVEVGNTQDIIEQAYPQCPFTWIEFDCGGHGVFVLTKQELKELNKYHDR